MQWPRLCKTMTCNPIKVRSRMQTRGSSASCNQWNTYLISFKPCSRPPMQLPRNGLCSSCFLWVETMWKKLEIGFFLALTSPSLSSSHAPMSKSPAFGAISWNSFSNTPATPSLGLEYHLFMEWVWLWPERLFNKFNKVTWWLGFRLCGVLTQHLSMRILTKIMRRIARKTWSRQ